MPRPPRTPRPTDRRRVDVEARAQRRAERRASLLAGALTAIRRDGPGVTMDAIAAEGGVTKPILYKHFGDRDGLVNALAERFADELTTELGSTLTDASVGPEDLLRRTVDAYLRIIEREPQLYAFLSATAPVTGDMVGIIPRIARLVALVLGERLRAVGHDSAVAEPWAHGLVGMVHLAGNWWVERGTVPRSYMVDTIVQLAWRGLASAGEPVPNPEDPA
jgi:AcrR family transcriptional regulator